MSGLPRPALAPGQAHLLRPDWRGRATRLSVLAAMLGLVLFGLHLIAFDPIKVVTGAADLGFLLVLMMPPDPGSLARAAIYGSALLETLAIAFLGTFGAAVLALPLGFMAARNVMPAWVLRLATRRLCDTLRGIDILIWALIWVNVVGLGPFAGVLAILASDTGTFGKLFSEAIEAADRKPVEGVVSAGGTRVAAVRFGILPQVLPVMASQVLYYFESNTRSATIIGIVGAGGIGLHLYEQIRTLEWQAVSFIVLMILALVAAIDLLSSRLRFAIIGRRG
ncbi:MAG: phosphonate ABC transporter, permease protein PhnE [Thalassobaculales bacterium]